MTNNIDVEGKFMIEVLDYDGNVKRAIPHKNRVVESGLKLIANLLGNTSSYRLKSIGIGSSEDEVTAIDTTLRNAVWKDITFTVSNNVVTGVAIFGTNEANQYIAEIGLRDTNDVLFSRGLNREPFEKISGEQLRVTWSITFENKLGI